MRKKKIVSADSVDIGVADKDAESSARRPSEEEKSLCGWMKEVLGERVGDVRMSRRLVESPAAAFNSDSTMTQGMKRIMKNISAGADMRSVVRLENKRRPCA